VFTINCADFYNRSSDLCTVCILSFDYVIKDSLKHQVLSIMSDILLGDVFS